MVDKMMAGCDYENQKNAANQFLKETIYNFKNKTIAWLIFKERMKRVIALYNQVPCRFTSGPKSGQIDPLKVSSIEKNKAYAYH